MRIGFRGRGEERCLLEEGGLVQDEVKEMLSTSFVGVGGDVLTVQRFGLEYSDGERRHTSRE